ncbi:MAG: hypothetical protein WA081_06045 [Desulfosalsimonadaceae bacterium]
MAWAKTRFMKWNAELCFADSVYRNWQVHWLLSAQTVCPRDPRKPPAQGRIAMGFPPPEECSLSFPENQIKTNAMIGMDCNPDIAQDKKIRWDKADGFTCEIFRK